MNCPTCGCCAKENFANNIKFYVCGECKEEVFPPKESESFDGSYDHLDLNTPLCPMEEAWLDNIIATEDEFTGGD